MIDQKVRKSRIYYQGAPEKMVNAIAHRRGLPVELIKEILYYNIVTPMQLKSITGAALSVINYHAEPRKKGRKWVSNLTRCYPFPQYNGNGKQFIYRDKKFNEFVKEKLEVDF